MVIRVLVSANKARRLVERLEIHHTPKHGSWLNIAEIELSVFTRHCLDQRIADLQNLKDHAAQWSAEQNRRPKTVDLQFTTHDTRIKLKRLYPQIHLT